MSNSVAPTGAEKPFPIDAVIKAARKRLAGHLRTIEDAIDRIDPSDDSAQCEGGRLDYIGKQIDVISLEAMRATCAAAFLKLLGRFVPQQADGQDAQPDGILDNLDAINDQAKGGAS